MATKERKKRVSCKHLPPPDITDSLRQFIIQNEERWFVRRMKFDEIFDEMNGTHGDIKKGKLRCILYHHCVMYGKVKVRRESKSGVLDESGWDRVKVAATSFQDKFPTMTLAECMVLMRTKVAVNKDQMLGLPKRLRTWKKKEK